VWSKNRVIFFAVWNKISYWCVVRDLWFTAHFKTYRYLNRSSQPTDCTEQVETCHTLLLRFDAPLPVPKISAFRFDCTRQRHSPYFLITVVYIYRVSQEECARLWESVSYVKLCRYNSKHLYPKLNGYGDNGQRSLKLWQLFLTYWLPNTYWNWQEYVVSVMLIAVRNIKVNCEWHKAIK